MSEFNVNPISEARNCDLTSDQLICVDQFKRWVETEAQLQGKFDKGLLLLFLRSCEFDVELSKTTFSLYYESRKKLPEWFTNRDARNLNLQHFIQKGLVTALIETDIDQPSITIIKCERMRGESSRFNDAAKSIGVYQETIVRRQDCQASGNIMLIDMQDCPWWLFRKMAWPSFCRNLLNAYVFGVPIRTQALVLVNAPWMASVIFAICEPFFIPGFRNKVHLVSDWSKIGLVLPIKRLPVEFGGASGPMKLHEDAFTDEVMKINEELVKDEEKYGFKS